MAASLAFGTIFTMTGCGESESETRKSKSADLTLELSNGIKLEMVKVEAGTFTMSARDGDNEPGENPHTATLTRDFYIGQTEVTQAQWVVVMGDNPSEFKGDNRPVENVRWNEAMEFCEKLNAMGKAPKGWKFTLPTETQWEYAARGGKRGKGYKYSGSNNLDEVAWYDGNSGHQTHPVGTKKANELGLYDMTGNVHEWCLDDYQGDSSRAKPEFDRGNDQGGSLRVYRGGGWLINAWNCRSAFRRSLDPGYRNFILGFRLALVQVQ
ncbi:MAG: formylglycine-generating enzyme family protein [Lentisphaeria bacterium]|nr:formylglycine-generating enzyme family protein [Lentisphaeria bacterium]